MELVGPLEKTTTHYQYILVILDYSNRYPEAISLQSATTTHIAPELLMVFMGVGGA